MQDEVEKIEYEDLGLYNKDSNLYFWDSSSIAELDNSEIKKGINILEGIISFWENQNDYRNYRWNEDISKALKGNSIQDYIDYREYVINNLVSYGVDKDLLIKETKDSSLNPFGAYVLDRAGMITEK